MENLPDSWLWYPRAPLRQTCVPSATWAARELGWGACWGVQGLRALSPSLPTTLLSLQAQGLFSRYQAEAAEATVEGTWLNHLSLGGALE